MIVFEGQLSKNAQKFFWKQNAKFGERIMFIALTMNLWIVFLLKYIFDSYRFAFIFVFLYLATPIFVRLQGWQKDSIKFTPNKIKIEDGYLICRAQVETRTIDFEHIKRVEDHGEWYYFVFCFGHISFSFICQKDLIVEGSIEEFEKIFKDLIVRKTA